MTQVKADVQPEPSGGYDLDIETLIIGAGAAGMVAALAAHEDGQRVLVVEADAVPSGSTALSAGLIPAAGTRIQNAAGIPDDPAQFADDIQKKAHGENDPELVRALVETIPTVIDWLADRHGLAFSLVDDFDYPGHSHRRMHGLPSRSGAELVDGLRKLCENEGIDIVCNRRATTLHVNDRKIGGIAVRGSDGRDETIGCQKLILACNGFGGNRAMVAEHLPAIRQGVWFGHDGNRGEAVLWGNEIGAETRHLGAFQGHGNVAHPHGILITWAVIMEGGVQVNALGERFWNETLGYSEAARKVLAQPGRTAFAIFDEGIAQIAAQFEDFRLADAQGAIQRANTPAELAEKLGLPAQVFERTLASIPQDGTDNFGRTFGAKVLSAPFCGVRVTGALFHTQGGLRTSGCGQVYHTDGTLFPNLFACGGAACGVSGSNDSGYLSGNGLLAALALGYCAGRF